MSRSSNRDELFSGAFANPSNSLLRLAGGWGNIGGPGMFMVRAITSGTLTSIFTGMAGAMLSAFFVDTAALPFLICSCAGFVFGSFAFYADAVRKALLYLHRYPRLLRIHLDANFPHVGFAGWGVERLRREEEWRGWRLRSMLVVGWLTAMPAIESLVDQEESRAVEELVDERKEYGE